MNNIIVNSEDNKQLALYIGNKIRNFKTTYPMKRDYCGDINDKLREELSYDGIRCKRIYGLYKVNTFIGWLDEEDFTEKELDEITKKYVEKQYHRLTIKLNALEISSGDTPAVKKLKSIKSYYEERVIK